ncbi:hypothetical protein JCM15519_04560 [Fundidesulfovibrio butyratiphilus]
MTSLDRRLCKLEATAACGRVHFVVLNPGESVEAAMARYENSGRAIPSRNRVVFVNTGIGRAPGDND